MVRRVEGFRLRPLFRGREGKRREAGATGGGGVLSVELARAVGLYRSLLRSNEGSFVIACKIFAAAVVSRGTLSALRSLWL